jgi:hypothetical protein
MFEHLKEGDAFTRNMGGIKMPMTVLKVADGIIHAKATNGPAGYQFDVATGAEIDEDLQWGPKWGRTGSSIDKGSI